MRPVWIGDHSWTTLSTISYYNIFALWLNNPFVEEKLKGYKLFRGKVRLRFIVQGFAFNYGMLTARVWMQPGITEEGSGLTYPTGPHNNCQFLQLPGVDIDAGQSSTYEIVLPFCSVNGWFDRSNPFKTPIYTLIMNVIATLSSASNDLPVPLRVRMYMSMDDLELSVPYGYLQDDELQEIDVSLGDLQSKELKSSGFLSNSTSALSTISEGMSKLGVLPMVTTPLSAALSGASNVLEKMGYSKPSNPETQPVYNNRGVGGFATVHGVDPIEKLSIDPKAYVSLSSEVPGFGTLEDTSLKCFQQKYGLVRQYSWISGAPDLPADMLVNPKLNFPSTRLQYTPVGYLAGAFSYWTGEMRYKVKIVCSMFHRGVLGISWIPDTSLVVGEPDESWISSYLTWVIDLNSAAREVEFVIPWGQATPFLHLNSTMTPASVENSNGELIIYEILPLAATTGTDTAVSVLVYQSGTEDTFFARPCISDENILITGENLAPELMETINPMSELNVDDSILQSNDINVDSADQSSDETKHILPTPHPGLISFGEEISSIKELCSRYCATRYYQLGNFSSANFIARVFISLKTVTPVDSLAFGPWADYEPQVYAKPMSFLQYFAPCYVGVRGGIKKKYLVNNTSTSISQLSPLKGETVKAGVVSLASSQNRPFTAYGVTEEVFVDYPVTTYGMTSLSPGVNPYVEFEVPFLTPNLFTSYNMIPAEAADWNDYVFLEYSAPAPTTIIIQEYEACGDDFSFHYFLFVPELISP